MPKITGINPSAFSPGDAVTLTGTGFGAAEGAVAIQQGESSIDQTVTSWSDTSITFTAARGGQSAGACRVDVVAPSAPATVWDFEGLETGLTGFTTNTAHGTVTWDAGGFARVTSTSVGVTSIDYALSASQVLVQFDIRRHQTAGSKQMKITSAIDTYYSNFTVQTAGYNSARFDPCWSDDSDGGDNDIEIDLTGTLRGGTSATRSPPFVKAVYQASDTSVVQDVTGSVWETWKFWIKQNSDNVADGELAIWKNGTLVLHLTNVWNCATTTGDGVNGGAPVALSNYMFGRLWLYGYANAVGVVEDYRNFKIGYVRPSELG